MPQKNTETRSGLSGRNGFKTGHAKKGRNTWANQITHSVSLVQAGCKAVEMAKVEVATESARVAAEGKRLNRLLSRLIVI